MSSNQVTNLLKSYPKVELHRHLEGALRFSTLLELFRKAGHEVPLSLLEQKKKFLVTEPMRDLITVLEKFKFTQSVLSSEEIITRITFEAIEDAVAEGIKILELRYAPTYILQDHSKLNFEKIHRAILSGVAQAKDLPIALGLICIFQRTLPMKQQENVLSFVHETKDTWVGVDLADNEVDFPAKNFEKIFSKCHGYGLPVTIHAGEVPDSHSPQNVLDAIQILGAQRIGHGLQIIHDKKIQEEIIKRKIVLELCPTSNWLTQGILKLTDHPFKKLMEAGILTTINSDDPGIFDIDLTNEYTLLEKSYQFSQQEFDLCNDIAAHSSFISTKEKQKFWPRKIND